MTGEPALGLSVVILIMASWDGGGCPKFWRDARRLAGWSLWDRLGFRINRFFFQRTDDEVLSTRAFFLLWRGFARPNHACVRSRCGAIRCAMTPFEEANP